MSWFQHLFLPRVSNNQRAKLLHPSVLTSLIVAFLAFQFLVSKTSVHYPYILGYAAQIQPAEIVRLTNLERQTKGLAEVRLDSALSQAAAAKAGDMFARDYWAHVSPVGTQPWYFITEAGYAYRYAGENLARDFSDPQSVVSAWMASPTHRDNLLSAKYQDIGVAVVDGRMAGRDTTLVVQLFGTRLSQAPVVSQASSFTVKAATVPEVELLITPTPVPPVTPISDPFSLTKSISILLLGIILVVLVIDIVSVSRQKIVRWTSKSVAHLIFISSLLIAAAFILKGQIL